jgi:uroporphyrinogen decarboxylase
MRPRDLVRSALEFASPPRVPRQAWVLPWAEEQYPEDVRRLRREFPDDIVTSPGLYLNPLPVVGSRYQKGVYVDEWGCRSENLHGGVVGMLRDPLIKDWSELDRFDPPACTLAVDRGAVDAFCASTDQFVLAGTLVRPFERLCFLRTMEQALVDLLTRPPEFLELFERLHYHYLAEVEAWAATDVDAIVLMDDWGAQDRMLVSPAIWRELYKPIYRQYCAAARSAGKFVFMHSDGWIVDILPDLIDVGVNALNSQIACMGPAVLGQHRGHITFWGEIDRHVLSFGTLEDVRRAVGDVQEHLYANGGVIAQCEFGPGAIPDNVLDVFRCWQAFTETTARPSITTT